MGTTATPVPDCATFANGSFATATASITRGSSGSFRVIVGDFNLNRLQAGTTITVTASAGTVAGLFTSYIVPDGLSKGPTVLDFTVAISATETAATTTVTVEVVTPDGISTKTAITVSII